MLECGCTNGLLFWKTPCARPTNSICATCSTPICGQHAQRLGPGRFSCPGCATDSSDSGSSWFDSDSGGSNSDSSDSVSGDSGGGDSGGSSD